MSAELLQRCDAGGRPLGPVSRDACHGDPTAIHVTVHLHIFGAGGRLFLQKRSWSKDLYPGRWDTAVGGHVHDGEPVHDALMREAREELGIEASAAYPLHEYLHANEHESEYVHSFGILYDGPFRLDPEEVQDGRFWSTPEIDALLGTGQLTPNFEDEYARLLRSGRLVRPA